MWYLSFSPRTVWFSRDGTCWPPCSASWNKPRQGSRPARCSGIECGSQTTLLQLYQHKGVDRRVVEGVYVYFSREAGRRREQRLRREARPAVREIEEPALGGKLSPALKAGIILFYSLLDERQQRL